MKTKRSLTINNTSRYHDSEVRRLVRFAYDSIDREHPLGKVSVRVTNTRQAFRGRAIYGAWGSRILVRIGAPGKFPVTGQYRKRAAAYTFSDHREAIISISAHEFAHIEQHQRRLRKDEVGCEGVAAVVLEEFRRQRQEIDREIVEAVETEKARAVRHQEAKAQRKTQLRSSDHKLQLAKRDELRWSRKLKLTQTKLRKVRSRVRRLERAVAALEPAPIRDGLSNGENGETPSASDELHVCNAGDETTA